MTTRTIANLLLLTAVAAFAQKTAPSPSFEVASVRPSDPKAAAQPANIRERGLAGVGGRFDMRRASLTYSFGDQAPMAQEPCGNTIRASLEKQGLRLVRRSIPYRKVVIESIERTPTEN